LYPIRTYFQDMFQPNGFLFVLFLCDICCVI
jgi:hypothetical protein